MTLFTAIISLADLIDGRGAMAPNPNPGGEAADANAANGMGWLLASRAGDVLFYRCAARPPGRPAPRPPPPPAPRAGGR